MERLKEDREEVRRRLEQEILREYNKLYKPLEERLIADIKKIIKSNSSYDVASLSFNSWKRELIERYVKGRLNGETQTEAFKRFEKVYDGLVNAVFNFNLKEHPIYSRIKSYLRAAKEIEEAAAKS